MKLIFTACEKLSVIRLHHGVINFSTKTVRGSSKRIFSQKFESFLKGKIVVRCAGKNATKLNLPKRSDISRLFSLARPEFRRFSVAIVMLGISSAVMLAMPFCVGHIIDIVFTEHSEDFRHRLTRTCQFLVFVCMIGALANACRGYLMLSSGERITTRLRGLVYSSLLRQDLAYFDKRSTGELMNRLSSDTALVGQSLTQNISDGFRASAQAIGGVGMMVYTCPKLAMIALSIVPPVFAFSLLFGRYVKKLTVQVQDTLAQSTKVADECVSNLRTVRSCSREMLELQRYNKHNFSALELSMKKSLASGIFWGMMGFSGNMIALSVFYFGGLLTEESVLTVGQLSSFLLYAVFSGASLGGFSSMYTGIMQGLGASSRLWTIVDSKPSIPFNEGLRPPFTDASVRFSNVDFAYPSRPDFPIFTSLTLDLPPNHMTAVVGASGTGKSSLVYLLLRLYEPQRGQITFNGHDIKNVDPSWLRSSIGTVTQEPPLFTYSVAENIAYGSSDPDRVSLAEIEDAARKANALEFIRELPEGFDSVVGERGCLLSGGQKQRVAIARAIIANPLMLILDEATSALDARSEALVQKSLSELSTGRTVLTIAHRISSIRAADSIVVLKNGNVAEMGTYEELIANPEGHFSWLLSRRNIL